MRTRFALLPVLLGAVPVLASDPTTQAPQIDPNIAAFEQTIDRLFTEEYPQKLETFFCSLGTNPELGFRLAGSSAEHAASERIAAEMRAMGLQNVRLEPVPVDAYEFRRASLTVGDRTFTASTLAGTQPTPPAGITAPLVYAKAGTAADFDALGDVKGKIVLVDKRLGTWWFDTIGREAAYRGASGIVFTAVADDPKFYSVNDTALGSFESHDSDSPPWIYVCQRDGDTLKAAIAAGAVTAQLLLDATLTPHDRGGTGYNVVGEVPGTADDGQSIVFVAHQDAHFRGALDDTGALVNLLTIAKAIRDSGHRPAHSIVFLATTGEEYGRADGQFTWAIGAWWAATRAHPDWAGRVRGLINLEYMAFKGAKLAVQYDPQFKELVDTTLAARTDLQPYGNLSWARAHTWTDQWTFSAAGLPSFDLITLSPDYGDRIYHTNFDTPDIVDWPYLAQFAKFAFTLARQLDHGLLPYRFGTVADEITTRTDPNWVANIGADPAVVTRWRTAVTTLREAATTTDTTNRALPASQIPAADRRLLTVAKTLNTGLASFAPRFTEFTVFPHEQVLWDVTAVKDALALLRESSPKTDEALKKLTQSGLTRIGLAFSKPVYERELAVRAPGSERLYWGDQAQLPPPLDLVPACRLIQAGDTAGAITELEARRAELLVELNLRLARVAATLEQATAQLREPPEDPFRP